MGEISKIAWTDSTINFWEGCTKVSAGCTFCYAEARDKRHMIEDVDHWGKGAPRRKSKSAVKDALRLNKKPWVCDVCGAATAVQDESNCKSCNADLAGFHHRRIFSLSLGDWLDPEVPVEWLAEMLDTVRQCDRLTWILCTKRPELFSSRVRAVLDWSWENAKGGRAPIGWGPAGLSHIWAAMWQANRVPPKNVWLLASVENQEMLDLRAPQLAKIPAVVHGLSCEPLLGPLDFGNAFDVEDSPYAPINWIIVGGESGPQARVCNIGWIRGIKNQCKLADVPFFCKQVGAKPVVTKLYAGQGMPDDFRAFSDPKGGDPTEWPADLQVREFPQV